MQVEIENIIQIAFAFTAGAFLGMEREYRSKPAGFRTMILICVGSCLFSILSLQFHQNPDRIASNIVSGIGFIGAGVVFKEGISVRGITSAATIWIAAAIGMCIGFKNYVLALVVLIFVLATLIVLSRLEEFFDDLHQVKEYSIHLMKDAYSVEELESDIEKLGIYFMRYKMIKNTDELIIDYKIEAGKTKRDVLNNFLINNSAIISFEV